MSSEQPYHNLMLSDASPDPKYDGQGDMLQADYTTDLKALTGQQEDIPLLISQQGTFPSGANS